jgi:hypothetical protein
MLALKGDKEIGDKLNKIIAKLAAANGLERVIDLARPAVDTAVSRPVKNVYEMGQRACLTSTRA